MIRTILSHQVRLAFVLVLAVLTAPACSVLNTINYSSVYSDQPDFHIEEDVRWPDSPFDDWLKRLDFSDPVVNLYRDRRHYVQLLNIGQEALEARIHLIRQARHSIYIQTYIWRDDESGRLVLHELLQAAQRGVKVYIITDALGSDLPTDFVAAWATAHPNLQWRYYNPNTERINPNMLRLLGEIAFNFKQFNQRMHNKTFIVDDRMAITGGRNYENDYFDYNRTRNFKDRDVMVAGPVVRAMTASFARYWAFKHTIDARELIDIQSALASRKKNLIPTPMTAQEMALFEPVLAHASDPDYMAKRFRDTGFEVTKVMVLADDPWKNDSRGLKGGSRVTKELREVLLRTKKDIVIQTPYLVLDNKIMAGIKRFRSQNPDVDVLISTNSLAATDNIYAYSYAFKSQQVLVEDLKFRIFEFRPVPDGIGAMMPNSAAFEPSFFPEASQNVVGTVLAELPVSEQERFLCIHAKSFVIDDRIAWVGSFNLDSRSIHLNTEIGLMVWDERYADALKSNMLADMEPGNSWAMGRRESVPFISAFSGAVSGLLEFVPGIDLWPFQYTSLFELKEGMEPIPFYDERFYDHYRNVGSFPEVGLSFEQIRLMLLKSFVGVAEPII